MRNIILIGISLFFSLNGVFSQVKQTIVVRPETYREKQERQMRDVLEFLKDIGQLTNHSGNMRANYLTNVKNSKYSVFVEKKLTEWKKKGEFEKTASWQKRLNDSTEIVKAVIQESSVDEFAWDLEVLRSNYYRNGDYYSKSYELHGWFFDSTGRYNADKEVLIVNTFWGKIAIPIPIEDAKNFSEGFKDICCLDAHFFIQNDQLALLSLTYTTVLNGKLQDYTYENPSPIAQKILRKKLELKQKEERELDEKVNSPQLIKVTNERVEESVNIMQEDDNKIFDAIEQMPVFPGGEEELLKFLSNNVKYSVIAQENGIQGCVICQFVVNKDGSIADVEVVRSVDPNLDKEAIRVIKSMPKWSPGKQRGKAVRLKYTMPVNFKLQ